METTDYPDKVARIMDIIHMSLTEDGFFVQNEIEKHGKRALIEAAAPILMKRWVNGMIDEEIEEPVFQDILIKTITYAVLYELQDKKLVDFIEDENGEEILFLTEKGKQVKLDQDLDNPEK
jgi:preprotein translocase subunit SecB